MAYPPSSYGGRPPLQGFRRSFTTPHRQLSVHERAGLEQSDAESGVLYRHPSVRIFSFEPPAESIKSKSSNTHKEADYPIDTIETLPWRSRTEELLVSGALIIEKIRGSVPCFKCGTNFVQALLRNSQCWCVDGESKFVLRKGKLQYYRFELPSTSQEDKQKVEELKAVLAKVLKYEKTPCPFKRAFQVELPDDAITPRRKGKWQRREGSLPSTPDTQTPPLRRSKIGRSVSIQTSSPQPSDDSPAARRGSDYDFVQTPRHTSLRTSYLADRPETPSSMASDEDLDRRIIDEVSDEEPQIHDKAPLGKAPIEKSKENQVTSVSEVKEHKPKIENETERTAQQSATPQLPPSPTANEAHDLQSLAEDRNEAELETEPTAKQATTPQLPPSPTASEAHDLQSLVEDRKEAELETEPSPANEPLIADYKSEPELPNLAEPLPEDTNDDKGLVSEAQQEQLHSPTKATEEPVPEAASSAATHEPEIEDDSTYLTQEELLALPEGIFLPSTPELQYLDEHATLLEEHGFSDEELEPLAAGASSPPLMPRIIFSPLIPSSPPLLERQDDSDSVTSTAESFHTLADDEPATGLAVQSHIDYDATPMAKPSNPLDFRHRHKRDISDITVTASTFSGSPDLPYIERFGTAPDQPDRPPTPRVVQSSASDESWPDPSTPSDIQQGLRRRLKSHRSNSPLPPSRNVFTGGSQNQGNHLTSAILQKACNVALVKPIEVVVLLVHVLARIAGGATVNDLMSGELFKRPHQRRHSSSFPDQAPREQNDDDEDDFGLPIRGRTKSADVAASARTKTNDTDADSIYDLD